MSSPTGTATSDSSSVLVRESSSIRPPSIGSSGTFVHSGSLPSSDRSSSDTISADALWEQTFLGVYADGRARRPSVTRQRGLRLRELTTTSLTSFVADKAKTWSCWKFVNDPRFQVVMLVLALAHWVPTGLSAEYMDVWNLDPELDLERTVLLMTITGCPLVIFTVLELLARIAGQAGTLWRLSSYRRFLQPLFHKFELCLLLLFAIHTAIVANLFVATVRGGDVHEFYDTWVGRSADQWLPMSVMAYRFVRIWGHIYRVSVQATEEARRELSHGWKDWAEEHELKRQQFEARIVVRLQRQVDKPRAQFAILLLVASHIFLYMGTTRDLGGMKPYYFLTAYTGYITLAVFMFEFGVRCIAQSGEQFFRPFQHKVEFMFLLAGMAFVFYTTWHREAISRGEVAMRPSGMLIIVNSAFHRLIRYVGIKKKISASRFDVHSVLDAHALSVFNAYLGDLLDVPAPNVQFYVQNDIKVRVQKARLNPEAFKGLLIPFHVQGGLVEDLMISIEDSMSAILAGKAKHRTAIRVKNFLLLVHPSPGLAEAGGLGDLGFWTHDNVLAQHALLMSTLLRRLKPESKQVERESSYESEGSSSAFCVDNSCGAAYSDGSASGNSNQVYSGYSMSRMRSYLSKAKHRLTDAAKARTMQNMSISLTNVIVQYEDCSDMLGCGHIALGMKIGKLQVDRVETEFVTSELLRLAIYMETQSRNGRFSHAATGQSSFSARSLTRVSSSWRTRLSLLLDQRPALAIKEMKRLDVAEKFRVWGFAGMDEVRPITTGQRHRRSERWPERRNVLFLLKGSLEAGPEIAPPWSGWEWRVRLRPTRVVVDDEQVRALRAIADCMRGWKLHREAFGWRPDMTLADLTEALNSDPPASTGAEHFRSLRTLASRTVARQWWLYAFRRVLAYLHMRPCTPWIDLMWMSHNKRRYWNLLNVIIHRQTFTFRLMPHPDEKAELERLQLRLSVFDIIDCQKRVIADAVHEANMARAPASEPRGRRHWAGKIIPRVKPKVSSHQDVSLGFDGCNQSSDVSSNVSMHLHNVVSRGAHFQQSLKEGRLNEAKDSLFLVLNSAGNVTAHLADSAMVNAADTFGTMLRPGTPSRQSTLPASRDLPAADDVRASPSASSICSSVSDDFDVNSNQFVQSGSMLDYKLSPLNATTVAMGTWTLSLPLAEMRIVRWKSDPDKTDELGAATHCRSVVLLATMSDVVGEAKVAHRESSGTDYSEDLQARLTVAASIGSVSARCLAPDLVLGRDGDIVRVSQPFKVPEPQGDMLRGSRVGEEVSLLIRANVCGQGDSLGRTKARGHLECRTADLRVAVFENLVAALVPYIREEQTSNRRLLKRLRHTWDDEGDTPTRGMFERTSPAESRGRFLFRSSTGSLPMDAVNFYDDRGGDSPPRTCRRRSPSHVSVQDGRLGPLGGKLEVDLSQWKRKLRRTESGDFRERFRIRARVVHELHSFKRRVQREQRGFERVVGLQGDKMDWTFDVDVGSIHLVQVGLYLHNRNRPRGHRLMVVEDVRVWPFACVMKRGHAFRNVQSDLAKRAFALMANGDIDSLKVWPQEDKSHGSVSEAYLGRCKATWLDLSLAEEDAWWLTTCSASSPVAPLPKYLSGALAELRRPTLEACIFIRSASELEGGVLEDEDRAWREQVCQAQKLLDVLREKHDSQAYRVRRFVEL